MICSLEDLQLTSREAVGLRLAQIALFAEDLAVTQARERESKKLALEEFISGTVLFAKEAGEEALVEGFSRIAAPSLVTLAVKRLKGLPMVRQEMRPVVALEVVAGTALPPKAKWVIDQRLQSASVLSLMFGGYFDLEALRQRYKRSLKVVVAAPGSPELRLALVGGSIAIGIIAAPAGPLAPVIGTAIGNAMGLSGAAATSAGLAWLGGGSLAAGGFGMAGGAFVAGAAAKSAYAGARLAVAQLAKEQPGIVILELAKIAVTVEYFPVLAEEIINGLHELESEIDARNKKVLRAIKATVRRIGDGKGKGLRVARTATRWVALPLADRLIDGARDGWRDAESH
jgi:hypothetical protein